MTVSASFFDYLSQALPKEYKVEVSFLKVKGVDGKTLYMVKQDSTGLFKPRNLQKYVTRALVKFAIKQSASSKFHLIACAKPSFLFSFSHKNPMKKPCNDIDLIWWWIHCLEDIPGTKSWIHIPNADQLPLFQKIKSYLNVCSNINIGYPYNKSDKARDSIPLTFSDDPKSKHFTNLDDENVTVEDFMSSLDSCFTTSIAALFSVHKVDIEGEKSMADFHEKETSQYSVFDDILEYLTTHSDFSNEIKAIDSTSHIDKILTSGKCALEWNRSMCIGHGEIKKRRLEDPEPITMSQNLIRKKPKNK
ncbi:hypothetical protein ROZALSC1DRAFT_30412 [Rozella allomycis CSF55]|uniref:histone acetyltransferase n=1 Tax=Rozella allomycis (strain CSF55) TaxID=988480 RepID=A0A4P9YF08_ROZAC|nr:hypothetical protein ROZALSC1DRAFT_30412 [Rozella allomycis CSF55]